LLGIRAGGLNDDTVGRAGVSRVAISAPFATHTRAASGRWDLLREPERVVATNLDDHLAIAKPGSAARSGDRRVVERECPCVARESILSRDDSRPSRRASRRCNYRMPRGWDH